MRRIVVAVLLVAVTSVVAASIAQRHRGAPQYTPPKAASTAEASPKALPDAVVPAMPKNEANSGGYFQNDRLKARIVPDSPIEVHAGKSGRVFVEGIWMLESKDHDRVNTAAAALAQLPRLASIRCQVDFYNVAGGKKCEEIQVLLGPTQELVSVGPIDHYEYDVKSWDEVVLIGVGRGPFECQSKVLTIVFASGAVSVSDTPTGAKGCEQFTQTKSYRLARGKYYVDTTPNNDADKMDRSPSK